MSREKQRDIKFISDKWCNDLADRLELDHESVLATRDALHEHFVEEFMKNKKLLFRGLFTISYKVGSRKLYDINNGVTRETKTGRALITLSKPLKSALDTIWLHKEV